MFMAPLLVGSAATGTAAATAGLFGSAGAVTLGGALSGASTILGLAGSMSQASNIKATAAANARNAQMSADANKKQLDYQAGQETAAGQHEAEAKRRKAELMLSRAMAVSAASGGGPLDESLMAGIVGEGEREAGYAMYGATERAKGLQYKGQVGLWDAKARGDAEIASARSAANATLLGGMFSAGTSLAGRFAPGPAPGAVSGGFRSSATAYDWD